MNFYCIEMCDTGDGYALAQLQAAYPDLDIKRVGRRLSVSKYQVMTEGSKPADYEQKLSSIPAVSEQAVGADTRTGASP